ncbi:DUF1328 domain-containing protein [Candidatus Woesearchaeota archaeon]|nr:DUF1328 domain-containing protein [Candidatus Woesearchaeota archaeon]
MVDLIWLAVVFLIISVVAYILGARGLAWFTADIAKFIVIVFIILVIVTLLFRFVF